MASLIYNSFWDDLARGLIIPSTDVFKVMLVTATYVENKDTHLKRSDITNEVVGTGYTAGGVTTAVTVTKDLTNDRLDVVFGAVSWASSTITARKAVIYKFRNDATNLATVDNLVAVNDFGADVVSTNGTFSLAASTVRVQN